MPHCIGVVVPHIGTRIYTYTNACTSVIQLNFGFYLCIKACMPYNCAAVMMINGHSLSISTYVVDPKTSTHISRIVNIRYFITRTSFITIFLVFIPINIRMCEKHVKPLMTRNTNASKKKTFSQVPLYEIPTPNVHNTYYLHVMYVPVDLLCDA